MCRRRQAWPKSAQAILLLAEGRRFLNTKYFLCYTGRVANELGKEKKVVDKKEINCRYEIKVLSMKSAVERRERIEDSLNARSGLNWSFFEPISGETSPVPYDEVSTFRRRRSVMSKAEVSCAASHISLINEFTNNEDLDYLIVLEGDIYIDPNFDFSRSVEAAEILGLNYLKLYSRLLAPAIYISSFGRAVLYRFSWPPCGTQAYILSKSGAHAMMQSFLRRPGLDLPIDQMMDRHWETGIPVYAFYPYPLLELAVPTSIHTPEQRGALDQRNRELELEFPASFFERKQDKWREAWRRRASNRAFKTRDRQVAQMGRDHWQSIFRLIG